MPSPVRTCTFFDPRFRSWRIREHSPKCTTRVHLRLVRCNHPHLSHNVYNRKHLFSHLRTADPETTRLLLGAVDAIGLPRVLVCVGLGAAVTDEAIVQMMFSCRRTICGETSLLTLRVMPAGPELGLVIV